MNTRKPAAVSSLTHKPLFLWFLGHELDHDELRRQVTEFKRKGWGGFIMHWISGGEPYMGARWLDAIEVIVDAAAQAGMEAWLYDEGWCPSGFIGGRLLAQHPELALQTIEHECRDVADGEEICLDFDMMTVVRATAVPLRAGIPQTEEAIDLFPQLGPVELDQEPPYRHDWGYYPLGGPPILHWRQSAKRRAWRLRWSSPGGAWRVYVFCTRREDPLSGKGGLARIDVFRPETVEHFLAETHAVYEARLGRYFGNVIPGIMTDEAKFRWVPWTSRLPELYRARYGEDLIHALPGLVDPAVTSSRFTRARYYRLLSDLFRENFMEPIGQWCEEHGLLLTGHISPEEHPSSEADITGCIGRLLESFHVPGTDLIIQAVGNAERPALNLGPRLASSTAHQQGRNRVFVEVGACCEEDMSLRQIKHLCDWLMVNGVNLICLHGMNYSGQGFRKYYAGQSYSYQSNLWHNMETLTDYLTRRSEALSEFRPDRRIAILKPFTALRVLGPPTEAEKKVRNDVDMAMVDLLWAALQAHLDVDLLSEDSVEECHVDGHRLCLGRAAYDVVLVPRCEWISSEAAAGLAAWQTAGGCVIAVGRLPAELGAEDPGDWGRAASVPGTIAEAVQLAGSKAAPPMQIEGANAEHVLVSHLRSEGGQQAVLLLNLLAKDVALKLIGPDGTRAVRLAPWESCLLPSDEDRRFEPGAATAVPGAVLSGPWAVQAERENHIPLLKDKTRIVVEEGAGPDLLVLDEEESAAVLDTLKIDGRPARMTDRGRQIFYDCMNRVYQMVEPLTPGEHVLEFESAGCRTVLLAGRFAAFADGGDWRVTAEPERAAAVDTIGTGYPYLRGRLTFSTSFELETDMPADTLLHLPGREGSVTAAIDGKHIGTAAWPPDAIPTGALARGAHTIELGVVGDAIGILRHAPCPAGTGDVPFLATP